MVETNKNGNRRNMVRRMPKESSTSFINKRVPGGIMAAGERFAGNVLLFLCREKGKLKTMEKPIELVENDVAMFNACRWLSCSLCDKERQEKCKIIERILKKTDKIIDDELSKLTGRIIEN